MKYDNQSITDITEKLHALADGQLDVKEREEILTMLENDPQLRGELCDIYRIKDLLQTAYPLEEFAQSPAQSWLKRFSITNPVALPIANAASVLLAVFLAFGAGYTIRDHKLFGSLFYNQDTTHGIALNDVKAKDNKVILYINSSEPDKYAKALSEAETLARDFSKTNGKVYVVASAEGIDLLRLKTSPYKDKIKKLTELYPVLDFIACNNTLYQYQKAGEPIELIDSAKVAPSAVNFVVKHLQKGWRYIAI